MIKVKEGKCTIKGGPITILAETTVLLKGVRKALTEAGLPVEAADKRIGACLTYSQYSDEELHKKAAEMVVKALKDTLDIECKAEEVKE